MKDTTLFESPWKSSSQVSIFDGPAEQRLFKELCTRFKGRMIAPQVSFSALIPRGRMYATLRKVLGTKNPKRIKAAASYLSKSRVDFVVYRRNGTIECVVESNGWTHKNGTRKTKDLLKANVLREVGVRLVVHGICEHLHSEFAA